MKFLFAFLAGFFLILQTASAQNHPDFVFKAKPGVKKVTGLTVSGAAGFAPDGSLNISSGSISIQKYKNWELTPEGFTAIITVKSDRIKHLAFFGKRGVFDLRQSGVPGPGMLFFAGEAGKSETHHNLSLQTHFSPGKYVQYAVSAEYINNPATGQIGYQFACYINGKLKAKKLFYNLNPRKSTGEFWLGNFGSGFSLCGNIYDFAFYRKPLTDGQIEEIANKNPYVQKQIDSEKIKLPKKQARFLNISPRDPAELKWLKNALVRSIVSGASDAKIDKVLPLVKSFNLSAIDKFNAASSEYKMVETPSIIWLISLKGTTEPVLTGAFDRRTGRDISGKRLLGWRIESSVGQISDESKGISHAVENYREKDDTITFDIVWKYQKLKIVSAVIIRDKRMEADLRITNNDPGLKLTRVFYPLFRINPPTVKNLKCISAGFSGMLNDVNLYGAYHFGSDYPSEVSMQFRALYDNVSRNGIYLGFEEAIPVCKKFGSGGVDGEYRYDSATLCAFDHGSKGGNSFETKGPAVIELYQGKWYEAGQIYKRFLLEKSSWFVKELPRKSTPQWYLNNHLWIIGGFADEVIYLRKYFGMSFGNDRTGFWYELDPDLPLPTMSPTTRDRANDINEIKRIKDADVRLQAYFNPRLWDFSQWREARVNEFAKQAAIKNEDGSPHLEKYGRNMVAVVCPKSELLHKVFLMNMKRMAGYGFDALYLDQTIDAHYMPCYDKNHGHILNSPYIWHEGYFQMLDQARQELRKTHPDTIFSGEGGNDVWCSQMDGYLTWLYGLTGHVPLIQSIYGGGRVQFAARGFESFRGVGDWDAFFCRIGEQFVNSEQLGWFNINDIRFGTGRRRFVKKLIYLRKEIIPWFISANMLAPLEFTTPMPQITCNWACMVPRIITTDKVVHAVWQHLDGRIAIPFVNTTLDTVKIQPILPYKGTVFVCREGKDQPEIYSAGDPPILELKAHEAQIWFIDLNGGKEPWDEIKATAVQMANVVTFDDGEHLPFPQDFSLCLKIDGKNGKWITANQASWLALVFREKNPTLGYDPTRPNLEETAGNWLLAKAGGLAFYGEIDFGEAGERYIEVEVSATAEGADGKLRLVDLTGGGHPDAAIAEGVVPDCGKYFDYKIMRLPLQKDISGKHKVAWSFEKPMLLRRWRIVK